MAQAGQTRSIAFGILVKNPEIPHKQLRSAMKSAGAPISDNRIYALRSEFKRNQRNMAVASTANTASTVVPGTTIPRIMLSNNENKNGTMPTPTVNVAAATSINMAALYEKAMLGEHLTDAELREGQAFFSDLSEKLFCVGPVFQLSAIEAARLATSFNNYMTARGLNR